MNQTLKGRAVAPILPLKPNKGSVYQGATRGSGWAGQPSSTANHTHSCGTATDDDSNLPVYLEVIFTQRDATVISGRTKPNGVRLFSLAPWQGKCPGYRAGGEALESVWLMVAQSYRPLKKRS